MEIGQHNFFFPKSSLEISYYSSFKDADLRSFLFSF